MMRIKNKVVVVESFGKLHDRKSCNPSPTGEFRSKPQNGDYQGIITCRTAITLALVLAKSTSSVRVSSLLDNSLANTL